MSKEEFPFQNIVGGTFVSLQKFWQEYDEMQKAYFWIRYKHAIKMFELTKDPKIAEWLMEWDIGFKTKAIIAENEKATKEQKREDIMSRERELSEKQKEIDNKLKIIEEKEAQKIKELEPKLIEKEKNSQEQHQEPVRRLSLR